MAKNNDDGFQSAWPGIKIMIWVVVLVVGLVAAMMLKPFAIVPAGHRGVVFNTFSGVDTGRNLGEGIHFMMPLAQTIHPMSVRVDKRQLEASAASKDLQQVGVQVVINYHLDPEKVAITYQQVGDEYGAKLIEPSVQESIKAVTAEYNATDLIAKRPEVKSKAQEILTSRLEKFHIIVDDFSITDFNFSAEFAKAIEAKQVAEQEALKKNYELQQAKKEAEIAVSKAEGERDAMVARAQGQAEEQRLLRASVNDQIIRLKAIDAQMRMIEKWDGRLPTVSGGATPLLNMGDLAGAPGR